MAYFNQQEQDAQYQQVFTQPVPQDVYDDDDLPEEPIPMTDEEERAMARSDRWHVIANVGNFLGVLGGVIMILALVVVLVSLVNWVMDDLTTSFTLLGAWR